LARGLRGDGFALGDLCEPRHHRRGIVVQDLRARILADLSFRKRLAGPFLAEFGAVGAAHDALGAVHASGGLFQFELGDLDAGRADVAYTACCARFLPIEVAEPEPEATVGLTGNDLGDLAAVDDDTQPWRTLGDWADRLSRFERELPGAGPLVGDYTRVAGRKP